MPVYEYHCEGCGQEFEAQRKFSDPPLEKCELCGKGPVTKLISRSSFALKGGGWYQSGYSAGGSDQKSAPASCPASGSKPACSGCSSAD